MGWHLDGRVSALAGTHTHVPTADARVLPGGSAYVTDLGMVGASNSIIGGEIEGFLERFLTQMPTKARIPQVRPHPVQQRALRDRRVDGQGRSASAAWTGLFPPSPPGHHDRQSGRLMIQADLHLHTTHSDGTLTPAQLVRKCGEVGLRVIAITDHDSTEGIAEAQRAAHAFPGLRIIPGIELSTDVPGSEIHVLGYFVDLADAALQQTLEKIPARDARSAAS